MRQAYHKKILLIWIKYGPSLMALTCCLKIFLWTHVTYIDTGIIIMNIINLILNILIVFMLYCSGVYFGYCWKHKSLCRLAMWGYIYYPLFIIFEVPNNELYALTAFYVIYVVIIQMIYNKL